MVAFATQVKRRRGTTAQNDAFTGAEGEIVVDTEKHELRVHDGETQGGHIIPTKDYGYSKTESDNLLSNKANTSLSNISADGKEVIAHQAMPSDRYIDLTLGASGATYTAPAAGYIYVQGLSTNASSALDIAVNNLYAVYQPAAYNSSTVRALVPVSAGAAFSISWINVNINTFRFFYNNGSK